MLTYLWNRLLGHERLKQRGDQLFLSGEFERAQWEYKRARSVLPPADVRRIPLDGLIGTCERLSRHREASDGIPETTEDDYVPGLDELFELAIADKAEPRAESYRILGKNFRAGYVALVQGTADRAVALLRKASSESPSSFVVHLELGRALSMACQFEEANECLQRARRSKPDDPEGIVLLAAVSIARGRFDEANGELTGLINRGERSPTSVFLLAKALSGLGRADEALENLRETVKLEPTFHEAFFEAGRLKRRAGEIDAAFELLNRACALAPDEIPYNREVAELVLSHRLDEEAGLAACDRLMVTDEENRWQYLSWIAELYVRRGWRREARDPLEKALGLLPAGKETERLEIERRLASL
ncbi:MAG TPA: tetratricopeptide repeat protein [Vicinamibacteria bacterium]|nr:tetratricopeptide repeat protein [Vicinamibacteria bacterium]